MEFIIIIITVIISGILSPRHGNSFRHAVACLQCCGEGGGPVCLTHVGWGGVGGGGGGGGVGGGGGGGGVAGYRSGGHGGVGRRKRVRK
jgi:hypothetical protein